MGRYLLDPSSSWKGALLLLVKNFRTSALCGRDTTEEEVAVGDRVLGRAHSKCMSFSVVW